MSGEQATALGSFDESFYLHMNPDVAEAVRKGHFHNAWEHYTRHGEAEGRPAFAAEPYISGCGILNSKPLILHVWWWTESPFAAIRILSQQLVAAPLTVLVSNAWSLVSRHKEWDALIDVAAEYRAHRAQYPQHEVVFLANDSVERQLLQWQGVESVVFQHNGFYHRDAMPRVEQPARDFDAVYIARVESYKRLELMAALHSVCVIFAGVDRTYYQSVAPLLKHVVFVNGDPLAEHHDLLSPAEVAKWCARSRCGLCLSAEEGAMFASTEYLLCGLPVVTTRSLGGRDAYFDDRYCITCDDTPVAVAQAVTDLAARRLNPSYIRAATLAKIMEHRLELLCYLREKIQPGEGSLDELTRGLLDLSHDFGFRRLHTVRKVLAEARNVT